MNTAVEFHDSEVSRIDASEGSIRVIFSAAYVHRSDGVPGVDDGEGYVQAVELRMDNATWKGSLEECVGKMSDGDLVVADTPVRPLPLPYEAKANVHLELQFANGAALLVSGTAVHVHQTGEARFVERFNC